jgi:hypothetical protein
MVRNHAADAYGVSRVSGRRSVAAASVGTRLAGRPDSFAAPLIAGWGPSAVSDRTRRSHSGETAVPCRPRSEFPGVTRLLPVEAPFPLTSCAPIQCVQDDRSGRSRRGARRHGTWPRNSFRGIRSGAREEAQAALREVRTSGLEGSSVALIQGPCVVRSVRLNRPDASSSRRNRSRFTSSSFHR